MAPRSAHDSEPISAPYELHDLRLQDQPALGSLERHALALRFGL